MEEKVAKSRKVIMRLNLDGTHSHYLPPEGMSFLEAEELIQAGILKPIPDDEA